MKLRHGRVAIELYELSAGSSAERPPLLLLHALGGTAADWNRVSENWDLWDGPVYAVDFLGHGESDRVAGRYYYPELFLIDADVALAEIGDGAYLAGAGLGAYVAMLLAGSRPDRIPAALLLPGHGLACHGVAPDFDSQPESIEAWEARIPTAALAYSESTDPFVATSELEIRPLDYVSDFAAAARELLFSEAVDPSATDGGCLAWWGAAQAASRSRKAPADFAAALRELAKT